jgi:hypothetical protein
VTSPSEASPTRETATLAPAGGFLLLRVGRAGQTADTPAARFTGGRGRTAHRPGDRQDSTSLTEGAPVILPRADRGYRRAVRRHPAWSAGRARTTKPFGANLDAGDRPGVPRQAATGANPGPCGSRRVGCRGRSWPRLWSGVRLRGPGEGIGEPAQGGRRDHLVELAPAARVAALDLAVGVELVEQMTWPGGGDAQRPES